MNPFIVNGSLRLAGFVCVVTGAALLLGAGVACVTAGVLLILQTLPPRRGKPE